MHTRSPLRLNRFVRSALSLALLASAAAAFSALPVADVQAKTITAVMHSPIRILDPIITTAHIVRNHGYMIYDTLLSMDSKYQPTPQMAEYKISDDGLTYTFTLREGLKWHDGAAVTSEDCIASLKRWGSRDAGGQMLMDRTASLTAVDARTFELKLKAPFADTLDMIAKPSAVPAFMMPARVAATPSSEAIKENIGSGPFKFVQKEYVPGVKTVYEKFTDYVPRKEPADFLAGGKVVKVDRVEWVTMPDAQTAVSALNSNEIDYIESPPLDLLPILQNNDDLQITVFNELGSQTMGRMNFLYPPFDNLKIRQAALLALDQESVLQAYIGNKEYYTPCASMYGCGVPFETSAGAPPSLTKGAEPEKARALLKEAGYDGKPIVIMHPTDVSTVSSQPVIAAQLLRKAGFTVDLQPMDWQTLVSRRASTNAPANGGWNMFFTNWVIPEVWTPMVNPMINGRGKEGWFGWPTDPKLEELRTAFTTAKTPDERKAAAAAVHQRAMEQVIYVPLGSYKAPAAMSKKLTGLVKAPVPLFWNLSKAD